MGRQMIYDDFWFVDLNGKLFGASRISQDLSFDWEWRHNETLDSVALRALSFTRRLRFVVYNQHQSRCSYKKQIQNKLQDLEVQNKLCKNNHFVNSRKMLQDISYSVSSACCLAARCFANLFPGCESVPQSHQPKTYQGGKESTCGVSGDDEDDVLDGKSYIDWHDSFFLNNYSVIPIHLFLFKDYATSML